MSLEKMITEDAANEAMKALQEIRNENIKKAIEEIQAVCEKYKVTQVPQVIIEGNQVGSQIVIASKI